MAEKNVILKNSIGDVLYPKIADNSVTVDKIADGAVTKEKLSKDVLDVTSITWSELKTLRDSSKLIPGHRYRITDYQCTTTQVGTQSAGHQFDIIVIADSTNKLNEKTRACSHDGDNYFKDSNLSAWQLWYSLDNDTKRFAWADDNSGKGVIYRMIDEYNNDCPYDFKNIQFKRYKVTKSNLSSLVGTYLAAKTMSNVNFVIDVNDSKMFYTFSYLGELYEQSAYEGEVLEDASITGNTPLGSDNGSPQEVQGNTIKYYLNIGIENSKHIQTLNNIVFLTYTYADQLDLEDKIYKGCYYNSFGNNCYDISLGAGCNGNSFNGGCCSNSFNDDCSSISLDDGCESILLSTGCDNISLGKFCHNNSFNDDCSYILLSTECDNNSFGTSCNDISFDNYCTSNSFGSSCRKNSLGVGCSYNSLSGYSDNNSFDNYCHNNSFGKCDNNSFGTGCNHITLGNYYRLNTFDNGVSYITFNGDGTPTNDNYIQYYHIKQGMTFDKDSKYTITARPGLDYELSVAKRSDGTVVEYNEADTHKLVSITDSDYAALTTKDSNTLYCIPE